MGPVSPRLTANPRPGRSDHQLYFAEMEAHLTQLVGVSAPARDPKAPFWGGRPELTARGLQRVPDPQLTAGQERSEDCDAQHAVRVQDQVAVEAGGTLL